MTQFRAHRLISVWDTNLTFKIVLRERVCEYTFVSFSNLLGVLKKNLYAVQNNYKYVPPWLAVGNVVVFRITVVYDLSLKMRETGFCSVVRLFVLLNRVAGSRNRRLVLLDAVARPLIGKHIARIAIRGSGARADALLAN